MTEPLSIARTPAGTDIALLPALANRHGLITGATGTGKTVTLQVIAERMSSIGVPVFMADVKGDLAGMSQAGAMSTKFSDRGPLLLSRILNLNDTQQGVLAIVFKFADDNGLLLLDLKDLRALLQNVADHAQS